MATYKPIRKTANGTEEIKIPYAVLADAPDLSKFVKTNTANTFTETQSIADGKHLKTNLIKSADDSKWIAEFTAAGLEIGGSGTPLRFYSSTRPIVANQNKELAYTSDIPAAVTESTVSGWGFTKNTGTVTSVAVKMNGATKGTVTGSGTIDLGTVLTTHQTIKTLKTNNDTAQEVSASEAISGTGTINLHKVAKTGSYNDLLNKPTIPTDTGATSVEVTGTGNAVTAASYNATNRKLTLTKGSTFLTSHQDISGKANLAGNNTFTGGQTITGQTSDGYSVNASGYVKGSWLQAGVKSNYGSGTGMVCVFDGSGWIYYRTPSEILSEASGVPKSAFSLSGTTLTITI